ncbi:phosphoribosylanthranilate isomerase [Companilactobacillus keshanensis]|uniref:N-(5'-phosphoribosyl)anthranilate isomerase n=1 Tax=Companilactobacillus keshanensis TaxID=2486003 RepID=A0ABW4BUX7_9LACO|nr:phosphoribosylanthranilate isomerase [Companilactobacillus keshanensis]
MTKIKICGLMTESDIKAVNQAVPDYAGFIFAEGRHHVELEQVIKLRKLLDPKIISVGVFVDAPINVMLEAVYSGAISIIQLHGNESEKLVDRLKDLDMKVIQVFKLPTNKIIQTHADLLMIDSGSGDGKKLDWSSLLLKPNILAGAIDINNVATAIKQVAPDIIDVSRGVETDNKKDPLKIKQIVNKVHKL